MSEERRRNERVSALFLLGVLLLNYPLAYLFSSHRLAFGVPLLVLYLFLAWLLIIVCTALTMREPGTVPPVKDGSED